MKRIQNYNIWLVFIAVFLAACASPNLRYAQFEDALGRAHLRNGEVIYYDIEIEKPMGASGRQISFQLPDGKILPVRELTYEGLKSHGFRDSATDYQPEYSDALRGYGALFFFRDDELLKIGLSDVSQLEGDGIKVGQSGGQSFHALPLSQREIEGIFGYPIHISDGHYW